MGVFLEKTVKGTVAVEHIGPRLEKAVRGQRQHAPEFRIQPAVVDVARREITQRGDLGGGQEPAIEQLTQIDEVRIARTGGEQLVRGITKTRGTDRADLPIAHAGIREEIHEGASAGTDVADAVVAGQRGDVREHAGRAGVEPGIRDRIHPDNRTGGLPGPAGSG
jgi:hypothetical protein